MSNPTRRIGFTLIELLVVISILGVLATLTAVYVIPAFQDNKNVQRGVDRIVTTLLIAKQRALRDGRPVGVRFDFDSDFDALPRSSRTMRYVEQPDLLAGWKATANVVNPYLFSLDDIDLMGAFPATGNRDDLAVQQGDWLRVGGFNYEIAADPVTTTPRQVQVMTPRVDNRSANGRFQVIRQTRPIGGEDVVELPQNVVINFKIIEDSASTNRPPNSIGTVPQPEIVFSPSGGVFNRGTAAAIVLWVQDKTKPTTEANTSRLIVISPRTGLVGSHLLSPSANPLEYALDGKSSGL
ncbi:MAG: type II secretion system protein GspH [Planctomycetia bacterium]|nr:type II secretion system protein GspH [Planctomycetia bacterium]